MKLCLQVLRQSPNRPPEMQRFVLDDVEPGNTILDCLNRIKWEQDGSVSFRRNCRNTICGSCALRINGRSSLACKENVGAILASGSALDRPFEPQFDRQLDGSTDAADYPELGLAVNPKTQTETNSQTTHPETRSVADFPDGSVSDSTQSSDAAQELPTITIAPLANLPVLRDLVVDMQPFWQKLVAVGPAVATSIQPTRLGCIPSPKLQQELTIDDSDQASPIARERPTPDQGNDRESRQSPDQRAKLEKAANCILCGACYSACNALEVNPEFLGPHALAKAQRLLQDSRDQATTERLDRYGEATGVWGCTRCQNCNDVCPMDVAPLDRIGTIKQDLLARARSIAQPETNNRPTRHRQVLVEMVRSGGWVDERQFAIRVIGNGGRDWRDLLALGPLGLRLLCLGKFPLTFERSQGTDQVRSLIDAVRDLGQAAVGDLGSET